ncbi:MAG: DUF5667 domain-containing protein [Patescibacteria group bacterium]|jgi:hypothetical protein
MISSRLLLSGTFVCLAFFMVIISAFRIAHPGLIQKNFSKTVFASVADEISSEASASTTTILGKEKTNLIDHHLPYPGILPDHPLYCIKMLRDKINLWLAKDPERQYELLLLYADKRLGAGQALIFGNQQTLGTTTITKAEKYLLRAESQLHQVIDKQGNNFDQEASKKRLVNTYQKHQEIISELKGKVSDREKRVLEETSLAVKNRFEETLGDYLPKPSVEVSVEASSSAQQ